MEKTNIVLIADRNFFNPSIVAMTSIIENKNKDSQYVLYFVGIGITQDQEKILNQLSGDEVLIRIVKINEDELTVKYAGLEKHNCCASISALVKFDLPYICKEIDKVLYLDGDIIVQNDLTELYQTDIEGVYGAAVVDSGLLYSDTLIRQKIKNYFNSGVMLLNLRMLREENIPEELVREKYKSTDNSLMDQHVLNKVFLGKIKFLEQRYNVLYVNLIRARYFHGLTLESVNKLYGENYIKWEDMLDNGVIIHYSSFDKPWKYSDVTAVDIWEKYYAKSPIHYQKLNRKKLHISMLNSMREHKTTSLMASFIWECETRGIKIALGDVFGYLKKKQK